MTTFPELTKNDVRSTSMGASGTDLQLSTAALKLMPYSVECKSHAQMAVYGMFDQCMDNCLPDTDPLLVIKVNHKEPLAVITLEHFFDLVKGKHN